MTHGTDLERDQSLANDVLFSLLMVSQLVVDVCGELSTRAGLTFADYTQAVRNLQQVPDIGTAVGPEIIRQLALLPGFRTIVMHEYVGLDYDRVAEALRSLEPVEELIRAVARAEAKRTQ